MTQVQARVDAINRQIYDEDFYVYECPVLGNMKAPWINAKRENCTAHLICNDGIKNKVF